jgi:hypothetical protein
LSVGFEESFSRCVDPENTVNEVEAEESAISRVARVFASSKRVPCEARAPMLRDESKRTATWRPLLVEMRFAAAREREKNSRSSSQN